MAKKPNNKKSLANQGKRGGSPPVEHQFKPGVSGNPKGRPSAGATLKEWINQLQNRTEAQLRKIARDKKLPWVQRAAAERILRTIEAGDLADMESWLRGEKTLADLRAEGLNTEVVKKAKVTKKVVGQTDDGDDITILSREIELHDRAGVDFDRISDRTDGKPTQTIEAKVEGVTAVQIITPLTQAKK